MVILGIETSCDETSAAIVRDGREIVSNIILSQDRLHRKFGGVVPELACRAHVESIIGIIDHALSDAHIQLAGINAIAVVNTPGLIGALLIGLTAAKTLCMVLDVPFITVNHLHAHIYANNLEYECIQYPAVSLVVSGGHTTLFLSKSETEHVTLGETIDDAAGEAFDKVSKILGLGYPGGPVIDTLAKQGNKDAIAFPRSYLEKDSLDFSFSGLKTAVLYYYRGQNTDILKLQTQSGFKIADIAASFQEAVIDVLVDKTFLAARRYQAKGILIGGGVAANSRLRERLKEKSKESNIPVYYPSLRLCTDNAAMVAGLAYWKYLKGEITGLDVEAIP
ncbi:MAG: tRNA (adenosine(37)-N6)-threonylcarbamoyltransferase complex transferase subunit TsaD [Candidatus Loosdrechtia sp.]|uniref:tRNA (adenosine(37)-N6)-threonylcarbamoyltransferase complex transferase subunit TsaD n=1 Tax=Candidatus Loosdrechtia sp. TaxID=3101272 RepID=UPI003A720CEB|nr:MAG: tRNA (adenosine(37)-N6)-threonylcarbamoyltransferase complex transferase subunit TsaD [Candidatus Jettenia sp. AMX2]